MTVFGQDALGVELHTFNVDITVSYPHDRPVLRASRDDERSGNVRRVDDERVVASDLEWGWKLGEHTGAIVLDP